MPERAVTVKTRFFGGGIEWDAALGRSGASGRHLWRGAPRPKELCYEALLFISVGGKQAGARDRPANGGRLALSGGVPAALSAAHASALLLPSARDGAHWPHSTTFDGTTIVLLGHSVAAFSIWQASALSLRAYYDCSQ